MNGLDQCLRGRPVNLPGQLGEDVRNRQAKRKNLGRSKGLRPADPKADGTPRPTRSRLVTSTPGVEAPSTFATLARLISSTISRNRFAGCASAAWHTRLNTPSASTRIVSTRTLRAPDVAVQASSSFSNASSRRLRGRMSRCTDRRRRLCPKEKAHKKIRPSRMGQSSL